MPTCESILQFGFFVFKWLGYKINYSHERLGKTKKTIFLFCNVVHENDSNNNDRCLPATNQRHNNGNAKKKKFNWTKGFYKKNEYSSKKCVPVCR